MWLAIHHAFSLNQMWISDVVLVNCLVKTGDRLKSRKCLRTVRNLIYRIRDYVRRGLQGLANKLSTPPPTANGDKSGIARKTLDK